MKKEHDDDCAIRRGFECDCYSEIKEASQKAWESMLAYYDAKELGNVEEANRYVRIYDEIAEKYPGFSKYFPDGFTYLRPSLL